MKELLIFLACALTFILALFGIWSIKGFSRDLPDDHVLPLTAVNRPRPPPPSPPRPPERSPSPLLPPVPAFVAISSPSLLPRTPPTPPDPLTPQCLQNLPIPPAAAAAVIGRSRLASPIFEAASARLEALKCPESQKSPTRRASRVTKRASKSFKKTRALKAAQVPWDLYPISEYSISELGFAPCRLVRPRSGMKPPCPNEPGGFF